MFDKLVWTVTEWRYGVGREGKDGEAGGEILEMDIRNGCEDTRISSKRGDIKGEERGQGNVHGISKKG